MIQLLNNNIGEIYIINNILYLKFNNIKNIDLEEFNKITFIYRYFNLICLEKKLNYKLVIDIYETELDIFEFMKHVNMFIETLSYTKPITNITLEFTVILLNSEMIKNIVNTILQMYNSGRPIYIVNNEEDINKLINI